MTAPLYDTVGELREFLARFPADTPVTVHYTGEGRVAATPSLDGDEEYICIAIHPATEEWLIHNGLPRHNPKVRQG